MDGQEQDNNQEDKSSNPRRVKVKLFPNVKNASKTRIPDYMDLDTNVLEGDLNQKEFHTRNHDFLNGVRMDYNGNSCVTQPTGGDASPCAVFCDLKGNMYRRSAASASSSVQEPPKEEAEPEAAEEEEDNSKEIPFEQRNTEARFHHVFNTNPYSFFWYNELTVQSYSVAPFYHPQLGFVKSTSIIKRTMTETILSLPKEFYSLTYDKSFEYRFPNPVCNCNNGFSTSTPVGKEKQENTTKEADLNLLKKLAFQDEKPWQPQPAKNGLHPVEEVAGVSREESWHLNDPFNSQPLPNGFKNRNRWLYDQNFDGLTEESLDENAVDVSANVREWLDKCCPDEKDEEPRFSENDRLNEELEHYLTTPFSEARIQEMIAKMSFTENIPIDFTTTQEEVAETASGFDESAESAAEKEESNNANSQKEEQKPSKHKGEKVFCKLCRKNGEPSNVYLSHNIKSRDGKVTCPILQKYVCNLCGATGEFGHTKKHCPLYENIENIPPQSTHKPKIRILSNGKPTKQFNHK